MAPSPLAVWAREHGIERNLGGLEADYYGKLAWALFAEVKKAEDNVRNLRLAFLELEKVTRKYAGADIARRILENHPDASTEGSLVRQALLALSIEPATSDDGDSSLLREG